MSGLAGRAKSHAPPCFIAEATATRAYDFAPHADSSIESIDVEDGEHRAAYDADGGCSTYS
jgi:hypothetical protein